MPLGTFSDFDDLVCDKSVGLTMLRVRRLLVGSLTQTEDRALAFLLPILQIFYSVLLLNLEVLPMGFSDRFGSQPLHVLMNIHIQCHGMLTSFHVLAF